MCKVWPIPSAGGRAVPIFLLDPLGRRFADQELLVSAQVVDDGLVHLVTADAHRARIDDAAEGQDGHFRGATANINDHGSGRIIDRQAGAYSSGHRLFDQFDMTRAGSEGRLVDGAALDAGGTELGTQMMR